jgi:hypothetical protein
VAISAKAAPVLVTRRMELLKKLLEFGHFWGCSQQKSARLVLVILTKSEKQQ